MRENAGYTYELTRNTSQSVDSDRFPVKSYSDVRATDPAFEKERHCSPRVQITERVTAKPMRWLVTSLLVCEQSHQRHSPCLEANKSPKASLST